MDPDNTLTGCAVRVLLKGEEMEYGNWIASSGKRSWVYIAAGGSGTGQSLRVEEIYIAECASDSDMGPDIDASTLKRLVNLSGQASFVLSGTSATWTYDNTGLYPIDKSKTYVVTFRVAASGDTGHARWWPEINDPSRRGCYILPGASAADTVAAVWTNRAGLVVSDKLYGITTLYTTYPEKGLYTSKIYDTHQDAPSYTDIDWNADTPSSSAVLMRVRTGASNDMADAAAWTNITAMASPGAISPGAKRYVQFQAELRSDTYGSYTPRLKDVTTRWKGVTELAEVGGTFTKGPDYGVLEVRVNGERLKTGVNIYLEIFDDVLGFKGDRRLTSALESEIVPRNTGR